ncbi:MAG: SUMF1/EgtB/PvdO family nonheme iron enzyme [Spirochaetales bacterium]|nr:SUMF1/EgtB/PvdO family nonheme iron enzyme [Spirochaetales bacterium]
MKKKLILLIISLFATLLFAQTKVDAKKIGKTLEKNKDATAVFTCDMSLSGMKVANDGTVILSAFAKNKVKIVSGMDMTNIAERLNYANKVTYLVTFETNDLSSKSYLITKIDGIETLEQYKERLVQEEKRKAEEAKAKWERERLENLTKHPVQVVNQEVVNISGAESAWLPGQIQDKLKSNLQEYLGMKTVVDSKSETALKKLQAESEDGGRDESTAIELGKITTAKFAVFTKLRKTGSGYTISVDFTDLTTGEQMASATSKEYSKAEYLYGSTGAVDELTLAIGNKLGIKVSDLNKNLLTSGSANFSVDAQLALAKQNEEQYQKMMKDYDAELSKLMTSNDINAIQNKNRIEAEKALLVEKQNAEKKRQEELKAQMARAAEDEKLEAERSIALKTQRDQMAKDAAAKAAEVRKLKMEKQGVLGQINVIESKKKALVEIRQGVENRSQELYDQMLKDKVSEESRIRNKTYSTVELGSDGQPTEQAKQRRENQVIKSNEELTNKFFADCDAVKKATASQDAALLAEIRVDQKNIVGNRTVSSMGDELKVSYGKYEGSKNGWNAYLSLYSDGILLYTDNFIVNYEALSGKKAPNMETELNDSVIEEYTNNVDMYNSLLTRGDPIIYFEIDYNVTAEGDDKPSQYKFNFNKIRAINTVSGKVTQTSALNKVLPRTMKPEWDLREIVGIVAEFKKLQGKDYRWDILKIKEFSKEIGIAYNELITCYFENGKDLKTLENFFARISKINEWLESYGSKMVIIPGESYAMLNTEVTQGLYKFIMGNNPGRDDGYNYPVSNVSWNAVAAFCNRLSLKFGLDPVYCYGQELKDSKEIISRSDANGFRLPTYKEWMYAARGGENYLYAGSDNLDEVGWYSSNSGCKVHPVAYKKANGFGLYDMTGNVGEWLNDISEGSYNGGFRYFIKGGSQSSAEDCKLGKKSNDGGEYGNDSFYGVGFRIVCNID